MRSDVNCQVECRSIQLMYGVVSYVIFFLTFLYALGFVGNIYVSKGIDTGTEGPLIVSVLINLALLSVFAIQHTIMARPRFKVWVTRIIPGAAERSTATATDSIIKPTWQMKPLGIEPIARRPVNRTPYLTAPPEILLRGSRKHLAVPRSSDHVDRNPDVPFHRPQGL